MNSIIPIYIAFASIVSLVILTAAILFVVGSSIGFILHHYATSIAIVIASTSLSVTALIIYGFKLAAHVRQITGRK